MDFLPVSQLSRLHALQVSRPVAGWLRLCILLVCVRGGEADTGFGFPSMPPCGFPGFLGGLSVGLFDLLGSYLSLAVSAVSVLLGVGLPCVVAVLGVTYLGFCLAFRLPKPLFSDVPRFGLLCALLCCCSLRVSSPQINSRKVWVGLAVVPSFSYGMPLNPGNADEQQRARRRAGIVLQADRVVLQSTRSRRDDLLTAFDLWLAENMQVTLHELLSGRYDAEAISDALVCYGKELYTAGKAYGRFSETINGITARKPGLRRQLASAWDLAFNWVVDEPHEHHTALPLTIMLALSALALLWGWAREASLINLSCPFQDSSTKDSWQGCKTSSGSNWSIWRCGSALSSLWEPEQHRAPLALVTSNPTKEVPSSSSVTWPRSTDKTWGNAFLPGFSSTRWSHILAWPDAGQWVCSQEGTLDQFAGSQNLPPRSCSCNFCWKNDRGFQTQSWKPCR